MKVSIVIPAYNEEDSIREVVKRTRKAVPDAEIIVVNDGSTDRTYEFAKKIGAKVISYKPNKGKIFALKTGYKHATGEIIGTIDSDMAYPPEEIPKLLKEIKDADIVVGSRFAKGFAKGLPWHRNLANIVGALFLSILVLKRVTDATSGMRIFRKELTKLVDTKIEPKGGLEYEAGFTTKAITLGYKYKEVPIKYEERRGRSKLKFFRDVIRFTCAILRARFG